MPQTELRIPLLHFFYVAPVLGSSIAYFGTLGLVPAASRSFVILRSVKMITE